MVPVRPGRYKGAGTPDAAGATTHTPGRLRRFAELLRRFTEWG
jgi:hypothetical protein